MLSDVNIIVNGEEHQINGSHDIYFLVKSLGIDNRTVAVARNGVVVSRNDWKTVIVSRGDVIEIVNMVGGG